MSVYKFFSIILHPIFTPIIFINLTFFLIPQTKIFVEEEFAWFFIKLVSIAIIIPLISVLIMYKKKFISSFEINKKEERLGPILITTFCYVILLIILKFKYSLDPLITGQLYGVAIILFSALIISIFWKISLHMLAIGGGCSIITSVYLISEKGFFFIVGLIATSIFLAVCRRKEKAHNNNQLIMGFLAGVIIEITCILFFI